MQVVRCANAIPSITLTLWPAGWIVLFAWPTSTDLNTVSITFPAEKQALMDWLTPLEVEFARDLAGDRRQELRLLAQRPSEGLTGTPLSCQRSASSAYCDLASASRRAIRAANPVSSGRRKSVMSHSPGL